jgi:PhzF family phenazine biosynthesis protein
MRLPLYQLDAFAERLFSGNPAAVCPLPTWLPDATLQAIAAENNLSETAFLVARGPDWELRWFTPTVEIDLCGHATLAAGAVVLDRLRPGSAAVRFHTRRAGTVGVERRNGWLELDFPARVPRPSAPPAGLLEALGGRPTAVLASVRDVLVVYGSQAEVAALAPRMAPLAALGPAGVIATARGDGVDFVSRFFAPGAGVDEDPVTGSAHCVLTPYWSGVLAKETLEARQISRRGGLLRCRLRGERVGIAGRVVPYLEGWIGLPDAHSK